MNRLIHIIAPPDPPMTPMTFTRLPVLHRFWGGGLVAAMVGFALGFVLWAWQQGVMEVPAAYPELRLWHARIQILMFVGSFLLGFALQSGPHVVGGQPPPSRTLLWLLPLLWSGFLLTLVPNVWIVGVGNLLISITYGGAAWFLWRMTLGGDPARRMVRGMPLAASFLPLAVAPWLALDHAAMALWVLWCGPMTSALVAGQQLIQNVLGGTLLQGGRARLFAASLTLAWILSGVATFSTENTWPWAGVAWLVVILTLASGTGFVQAAWRARFKAINVTLVLGFLSAGGCALLLGVQGRALSLDAAVHLLGAGALTTLILGVAARVAGFFSGDAVLNDRVLVYLLLLWSMVALLRTLSTLTPLAMPTDPRWLWIALTAGGVILTLWSLRVGRRLWQIDQQRPPDITGQ